MIAELGKADAGLKQSGIALHLVTSEPGGDDVVKARLAVRECETTIPLHTDPSNKLLASPADDLYVVDRQEASKFNSGKDAVPYEDYDMVQPALIVVDAEGAIVQVCTLACILCP